MKKNLPTLLGIAALFSLMILSCGKDETAIDGDGELITTLRVTMTEAGSTGSQVFTFRDVDGPGGQNPSAFDSIIVNANRSYSVALQFLNESVSPAVDITPEVVAEANDHQVYFEPAGVVINVLNPNLDGIGLPLGTTSTWNAGAAGTGRMKITLKHKPGTKAAGDPVSKGETDVEVEFNVRLK
jgi:hypothetical protein